QEVVRLEERVRELGERDAALLARDAALHRLLGQELVHGEVLADVAQEIDEREPTQPVEIIAHARGVRLRLEVQKVLELRAYALGVLGDLLLGEELPLGGLPGRIPDEPRATSDEGDRRVARAL